MTVDFTSLYDLAGPGPYYAQLSPTGYRIPSVVAAMVVEHGRRIREPGRPLWVLDLACGYGFNGEVLLHGRSPAEVFDLHVPDRDGRPDDRDGDTHPPAGLDDLDVHLVGLDVARHAVAYAVRQGRVHEGYTDDLTTAPAGPQLAAALASVGLVIESGAIGALYVPCFEAILAAAAEPWFIYCPRADIAQGPVDELWQRSGYRRDHLLTAEPYRRPLDEAEAAEVLERAATVGNRVDTAIVDGFITVDVCLARPIEP